MFEIVETPRLCGVPFVCSVVCSPLVVKWGDCSSVYCGGGILGCCVQTVQLCAALAKHERCVCPVCVLCTTRFSDFEFFGVSSCMSNVFFICYSHHTLLPLSSPRVRRNHGPSCVCRVACVRGTRCVRCVHPSAGEMDPFAVDRETAGRKVNEHVLSDVNDCAHEADLLHTLVVSCHTYDVLLYL